MVSIHILKQNVIRLQVFDRPTAWIDRAQPRPIHAVGPSRCAADSIARGYDHAFDISSLNIVIAVHSALHVCRLIIIYTLWEALKAMEQVFQPITGANLKGNLKNGRIYLL